MRSFRVANYSPHRRHRAVGGQFETCRRKYFPGTPVVPHITSGYTGEPAVTGPLGIIAYGYNPYAATEEEGSTEHGNDERIRVEEVRRGTEDIV